MNQNQTAVTTTSTATPTTRTFEYACTGSVDNGTARCRRTAKCADHTDHQNGQRHPAADVVLVKRNVNQKVADVLENLGLRVAKRDLERQDKLEAVHAAQAKRLGRNPNPVRQNMVDSGCPVFGKDGAPGLTCVSSIREELESAGYQLVDCYLLKQEGKFVFRLVLQFVRRVDGAQQRVVPADVVRELDKQFAPTFGRLHVWSNPMDGRGLVVDTINAGEPQPDKPPEHRLIWADGDWDLVPVNA